MLNVSLLTKKQFRAIRFFIDFQPGFLKLESPITNQFVQYTNKKLPFLNYCEYRNLNRQKNYLWHWIFSTFQSTNWINLIPRLPDKLGSFSVDSKVLFQRYKRFFKKILLYQWKNLEKRQTNNTSQIFTLSNAKHCNFHW